MEEGRSRRCSPMDQSLMCRETDTTSWVRAEQVQAIAIRQEHSPEPATTPLTLTSTRIYWTYLAAGTSSPVRPQHPPPCAIHPASTPCTTLTTTTSSLSTRPTWCLHHTSTITTALHSSVRQSTPPAPCPTRITLDQCHATTRPAGPTSQQVSSHSSSSDQGM